MRVYLMKANQTLEKIDEVADILTTLKLLGIDSESFNSMLDDLPIYLWVHDENHTIVYGNNSFKENFGALHKQTCHQCLMGEEKVCSCCPSRITSEEKKPERCKLCKRGKSGYDLNVFHTPITNKEGRKFVLKSSLHIKDLGVLAENHFSQTQDTKNRKTFLVMCASCKKVRDQHDNWVAVDNHIIELFDVRISHGICPECIKVLYPMLNVKDLQENAISK
jgi:hypothetical protein